MQTITTDVKSASPFTLYKKPLICLPAYNEEESIGEVLDNILAMPDIERYDILVVDDGSVDDTRSICESKGVMVITHIYNMGYGAALKTAYKYATEYGYGYLIQMDADGQHDVSNIEKIYKKLTENQLSPDIIIGSRFLENSVSFKIPFYKRLVMIAFCWFIKFTTKIKITDSTSGLQGLNRRAFTFYSKYDQFARDYPDANMIIQMLMNDFMVSEIPAVMHERQAGVSMHSGIYKPLKYIFIMTISVMIAYMRGLFAVKSLNK